MRYFESTLSLNVTIADLPEILAFVDQACEQAVVGPELCFDLQLAVEEACANVIEHAYQGRGGELSIRFEARNSDIVITLHDRGQAFDPAAIVSPDTAMPLAKRPIGGLGLHLMYQLMDEIRFSFEPDGNTLMMVKHNAVRGVPAEYPSEELDG